MGMPLKTYQLFGAAGLLVASAFGSAIAQNANNTAVAPSSTLPSQTVSGQTASPSDAAHEKSTTYATGQPLPNTDHEGFWGHVNPLARKKWVHRQIDPVKDRVNELDELQAKNANDIKDVDARATVGIEKANAAAQMADEHASAAASRADSANSLAVSADSKTTALNGTVSTLDQYNQVSATQVNFLKGRTTLTAHQKADLDQLATTLSSEKGYIVEVRGYSRAGVAPSQAMADSVVRYLVEAHQIPVYRIYRTGMGRVKPDETASADGEKPLTNGVRVTVLHNSLATMGNGASTTGSSNVPATPAGPSTGVASPTSH
jgi:outer membrane protein OmpA-like peptidoglycan-associated protein